MIPADCPAKLSVSITDGMSVEIALGIREVRIGRAPEADLRLPDPSVSRLHARIFRVGRQYFLSDASRNGTFVGNDRITQIPLESGNTFRIGPYHIHFRGTSADRIATEAPTIVEGMRPAPSSRGQSRPGLTGSPPPIDHPLGLVGKSVALQSLLRSIRKVAASDFPVLVEGETGCGKELVSRGIHDLSSRKGRPFVVVNCGAISSELIESELFGHEKGAFTGATAQRKGAFEIADSGSIFLDEIGTLSCWNMGSSHSPSMRNAP